ncbi:MAG: TRAP transporter substrate-binding protein DctP [Alphaproteobacteria bacterium]
MRVSSYLAAGLLVGACIATGAAQAAEKVSWNWSVHGPSRAFTKGMERLAEIAGEKTDGAFEIKIHFAESVSPAREVLDSVKIGVIEGGIMCISYAPGKAPLNGVLDLPFLPFENLTIQKHVHEAVYKHPTIVQELQNWDSIPFFSALLPQYEFMGSGRAPRTLDDWKGMRVRALAGLGEAMKALGAVPTTVPAPEVYTALERGTFQAASFPFSYAHATYKLHEVSRWYTMGMAPGSVNCPLVVSRTAFNKLPSAYKTILLDAKADAYAVMMNAYKEADEKNVPMFDQAGLERITYSPEVRAEFEAVAAKPVWDAWVADMERRNLPGREILDLVLSEAAKAGS